MLFGGLHVSAPPLAKPKYVDYPSDYIIPIPGEAADTSLYCFPVHGSYSKLQQLVDERLNCTPLSKYLRFFPLSNCLLFTFSDIQRGYTLDKSYTKYGVLEEKALQVFMPLAECVSKGDGTWSVQRIVFFIPYIFVDQPLNVSIGREELGYPKSLAQVRLNPPSSFEIDTYGFQKFDAANPAYGGYHPLVQVNSLSEIQKEKLWHSHADAWQVLKGHLEVLSKAKEFSYSLPFVFHELGDFLHKRIPLVFLKQFRDIEKPETARFQAITEGDGILDHFKGGGILHGEHQIHISDFASYPMKTDLGLVDTILVKHAFWMEGNLRFNTGKNLWRT